MTEGWRPAAGLPALRRRARALADIRAFFAERGCLEVDTPVLGTATVTDPQLASLSTTYNGPEGDGRLWLQTSPEYFMKRLLAAGSGPIYQIAHAFRDGERGRWHNPEFTLVEWYRPGFDQWQLMEEVAALVTRVLPSRPVAHVRYADAFQAVLKLDPLRADDTAVQSALEHHVPASAGMTLDRDGALDLLMGGCVAPTLGAGRLTFLTHFPASQAALARLSPDDPRTAERFELFIDGVEIANGFRELTDPAEQAARFDADRARRRDLGLPVPAADRRLLAALEDGLPSCAGVALGFDRLLMLAEGATRIDAVMPFPVDRA